MLILLAIFLILLTGVAYPQSREVKNYGYKVEQVLPHDRNSYTQGLFFHEGQLYESAGQYGESSLAVVDLKTGRPLKKIELDRRFFAEGSCVHDGRLYMITWRENVCFVYDPKTLKPLGQMRYPGEGWGLTSDGKSLIMSDGSSRISFRNPRNFAVERVINVTLRGQNVNYLNELEYIDGEIWANVYTSDIIVRINPSDGKVTGVINCAGLLPRSSYREDTDVLNGIAYDKKNGYIYLTGKNWPKMYRISLKEK